jgi:hypothetical protein
VALHGRVLCRVQRKRSERKSAKQGDEVCEAAGGAPAARCGPADPRARGPLHPPTPLCHTQRVHPVNLEATVVLVRTARRRRGGAGGRWEGVRT